MPVDRGEVIVGVKRGYVNRIRIGDTWYFVDVLSSEFAALLQRAYEEMEP